MSTKEHKEGGSGDKNMVFVILRATKIDIKRKLERKEKKKRDNKKHSRT